MMTMKNCYWTTLIAFLAVKLLLMDPAKSQNITQTIRGEVVEQQSKRPLMGANVVVTSLEKPKGTTTNKEGEFKIEKVPIGRQKVQVSYLGYKNQTFTNLSVESGSETILNVKMEEKVIEEKEVEVTADQDKMEANNDMATVSSRSFTIEESQRFAGSRNDVARMASNFAGVQGTDGSVNDIVIRGNSPIGLLWRMEGIDIPNPNHFGGYGSTGGPVSMLNNNTLAQSDFYTSAFPAQYGDAYSGVFDLQMRKGNDEKHEFLGQVGFNGFEGGLEGPINQENGSSYMVNYRYSMLSILKQLGLNFGTGTAVPKYQDVNFKLHFPGQNGGHLSVFGLGGKNQIKFSSKSSGNSGDNLYTNNQFDILNKNQMGVLGVKKQWLPGDQTVATLTLAATHDKNTVQTDSVTNNDKKDKKLVYDQNFVENKLFSSFKVDHKVNSQHSFEAGIRANHFRLNVVDSVFSNAVNDYRKTTDFKGNTNQLNPYLAWQFNVTDQLTINSGLHSTWLTLNDQLSLEPRIGAEYQFGPNTFNAGFGYHSQKAPMNLYFQKHEVKPGTYEKTNQDLGFIRAYHGVIGYERQLSPTLRLKGEAYYQDISQAIVEEGSTPYSILNYRSFRNNPSNLKTGGEGTNYGLDLTMEKFMDEGFYYLLTGSLYKSQYKGSDSEQRSTANDGNFLTNFVFGKEIELWKDRSDKNTKTFLVLDGKVAYAGGKHYTPIDEKASRQSNEVKYQTDQAYSDQFKNYFRADLRTALKINGENITQEFAIDVQNITDHQNPLRRNFNKASGEVETIYQTGILPVAQYKIQF